MKSRFLLNMTAFPEMIRNVAVVGHLHHGKTALMDMLVFETHKLIWDADKPVRKIMISWFSKAYLAFVLSFVIQIRTSSRESARSPLNLLRCHSFSKTQPESPISSTLLIHLGMSTLSTKLLRLCVSQTVSSLSWM
jgi:hypothetical protein